MKKKVTIKIIMIIVISISTLSYIFLLFFSDYAVKYDLTDCVTYFDKEGRYRLLLVADKYFLVDGEREYPQKSNVKSYYYTNNKIYGTCLTDNGTLYFVLDIGECEGQEVYDTDYLTDEAKAIFKSDRMIKLNIPNEYERHIKKFIPLRFRKK